VDGIVLRRGGICRDCGRRQPPGAGRKFQIKLALCQRAKSLQAVTEILTVY
jgi:hypothetical protein